MHRNYLIGKLIKLNLTNTSDNSCGFKTDVAKKRQTFFNLGQYDITKKYIQFNSRTTQDSEIFFFIFEANIISRFTKTLIQLSFFCCQLFLAFKRLAKG